MFVLKLDDSFFVTLDESEGWDYTDNMEEATPLDLDIITGFLDSFKEKGSLTVGTSDFFDISILELGLIIKNEVKIKK